MTLTTLSPHPSSLDSAWCSTGTLHLLLWRPLCSSPDVQLGNHDSITHHHQRAMPTFFTLLVGSEKVLSSSSWSLSSPPSVGNTGGNPNSSISRESLSAHAWEKSSLTWESYIQVLSSNIPWWASQCSGRQMERDTASLWGAGTPLKTVWRVRTCWRTESWSNTSAEPTSTWGLSLCMEREERMFVIRGANIVQVLDVSDLHPHIF